MYCWPHLQYIDITGTIYTAAALKALVQRVSSLSFGCERTTQHREEVVLACNGNKLKHLHFTSGKLTDGDLYFILKHLFQLESLTIQQASLLSERALRKIAKYGKNLSYLALHHGRVNDKMVSKMYFWGT